MRGSTMVFLHGHDLGRGEVGDIGGHAAGLEGLAMAALSTSVSGWWFATAQPGLATSSSCAPIMPRGNPWQGTWMVT